MAYEFRLGELKRKHLRRIAMQQLRKLRALLDDASDTALGHHQARRSIKRLRALLSLAMPLAGTKRWRKLDARLGEVARQLAGRRDAAVMLQVLKALGERHGAGSLGETGARLQEALQVRSRQAGHQVDLDLASRRLKKVQRGFKTLDLREFGRKSVFRQVASDYRAGRIALTRAYRKQHADDFHALRKMVQRHWRHMQLFALVWPQEMQVRVDRARELSDILGDDHDLWVLRLTLRNGVAEWLDPAAANILDALCRKDQAELRAKAQPLLAQLFAERPTALRKRLSAYWGTASEHGAIGAHGRSQRVSPPVRAGARRSRPASPERSAE